MRTLNNVYLIKLPHRQMSRHFHIIGPTLIKATYLQAPSERSCDAPEKTTSLGQSDQNRSTGRFPVLILIGSNFTIRQFWLSVPAQTGLTWSDFRQIAPLGAATRDCAKWREPSRPRGGGEREWTGLGAYLHWRHIELLVLTYTWSPSSHAYIRTFHIQPTWKRRLPLY